MNLQDEKDKKMVSLYGQQDTHSRSPSPTKDPILNVDFNCASCSGHNQHISKLFKLACIQYQSQKISYKDRLYQKEEVIDLQHQICDTIDKKLQGDPGTKILNKDKKIEVQEILRAAKALDGPH